MFPAAVCLLCRSWTEPRKKEGKRWRMMPTQQVGSSSSVVIPSRPVKNPVLNFYSRNPPGGLGGLGEGCLRSGEQTAAAKFKHHQRNVSGSQRSFCGGLWCRFATSLSDRARAPSNIPARRRRASAF